MSVELSALAGRLTLPGGKSINRVGIGCWAIGGPAHNLDMPIGWTTSDDNAARHGLDRAYELGANLFDTADVYGHGRSERLLGDFLRHIPRHQVAVTSKVGYFTGTAEHAYDPLHMRHQLEQTLRNLGTDHLDVYSLHNANFGPEDRYLEGAIEMMRGAQREGLVRAIGMRGPHRFGPDRLNAEAGTRENKYVRFQHLFEVIRPEILSVRHNLLTPSALSGDFFSFSTNRSVVVFIYKPLGQGLLTGKYEHQAPIFGEGDHRLRKRWFTPPALGILRRELAPLRKRFGASPTAMVRVALRYCLHRRDQAAVLVGFTSPSQVEQNLTCLESGLTDDEAEFIEEVGRRAQAALNSSGEVFLDEVCVRHITEVES